MTMKTKISNSSGKQGPSEIVSTLKDKNIRLTMLKEASLIQTLVKKFNMKPSLIQKKTNLSPSHIYNLMHLASMTPRMKKLVQSGVIKGTDALALLRKSSGEEEFIKNAEKLAKAKIDMRRKEFKQKATELNPEDKKKKIKEIILSVLGEEKLSKNKSNTINSLIEELINNAA